MLDIIMPSYNHEKYISQAIQSVLMQECSFDYRLIIGEDCSTDGTLEICQQFANANPNKILLIKQAANSGIAKNYKALFSAATAKYIAILEGDDYWIDEHKLQKQVQILESNSEIGLVHANYSSLYENGQKKKGHLWDSAESLNGHVIGNTQTVNININPLTTCFRADLVKDHVDFDFIIKNQLLTVDIFLWAEVCRRASVVYIDEVVGVYRIHAAALTGNREISAIERFSNTSYLLVNYLMDKYETSEEVKATYRSQNRLKLIYQYLLANQPLKAKRELKNVQSAGSLKNKIIFLSAKYRALNFLSHMIASYYRIGSNIKQFIGRLTSR